MVLLLLPTELKIYKMIYMEYFNMCRINIRSLVFFLTVAAASVVGGEAWAVRMSHSLPTDHRIHVIEYQKDEVYKIYGHYGYQAAIEFEADEAIQTISMGDSQGWALNPSGNLLFLKPVEQNPTTNVTLITNKRTYFFEFHGREADDIDDPNMVFVTRFVYADAADGIMGGSGGGGNYLDGVPEPDVASGKYNTSYTISGSDEVAPLKIFDDGEFTYFQFADKNAEVPAFYWVDDEGNESIVNYRTRGTYIVIERVASRFTLRHGIDVVCVFNEKRLAERANLRR